MLYVFYIFIIYEESGLRAGDNTGKFNLNGSGSKHDLGRSTRIVVDV